MRQQDDAPVVAVWRSNWLPSSETFIRNQVGSLRTWRPLLVGFRRIPDGLDVCPDYAPYDQTLSSRISLRLNKGVKLRLGFDRVFRTRQVRVVHAHFGPGAITVLPIARRCNVPLVVTFHGYDATSAAQASTMAGQRYREALGDVFAYSSRLIAVSDFIASRLVGLGAPSQKISVVPIGIPTQNVAPPTATRTGITFVGRLVESKGVADLIDAYAQLPRDLRGRYPLRIVGSGPLLDGLQRQARDRGVTAEFLGYQDSASVASILAGSALFVGPSKTASTGAAEAFGMVYLEAALQGVPVIAYRHGGVVEAVEDGVTGILVAEGEVASLARAMRDLLDHPEYAERLGGAGAQRVVSVFDIRRRTAELERIYDDAASEAR